MGWHQGTRRSLLSTLPLGPKSGFKKPRRIGRQIKSSLLKALMPFAQTHLSTNYNQCTTCRVWRVVPGRRKRRKREVHSKCTSAGTWRGQSTEPVKARASPLIMENRKRERLVKHEAPIKLYWSIVTMEPSHKHTQIRPLIPCPLSAFLFSIINRARVELGESSTVVRICSLLSSNNPLAGLGRGRCSCRRPLPEAC